MDISLVAAFFAGVASLLSPCVLPLLPTYFAFLGANSAAEREKGGTLLQNALFFFCGFTLVFVLMGISASLIGRLFFDYQEILRKAGAVFMVLMGLQLSGILAIPLLQRENRPLLNYAFRGPVGSFILGAAFTAGWTPCIGPILAAILMYAGTVETTEQGAWLLFFYALGFCLPFFMLAFLYKKFLFRFSFLYAWLPLLQRISGLIIVVAGIALYFDLLNAVLAFLTRGW